VPVAVAQFLAHLEAVAPLELAESWDNVGLLVEPFRHTGEATRPELRRVLLTIDLTLPVLEEAVAWHADLVVAYHPPIFAGLKRLVANTPGERVLIEAIRAGIAVYSPHTALDAAPGGVNDWLLEAMGPGRPLAPSDAGARFGRTLELQEPVLLPELLHRIKAHLGVRQLRVAPSARHATGEAVQRVAVCAGSGGAVFAGLPGFDLYVTGEMRHHDVLSKVAAGSSVVLAEHTNSERGYLPRLSARLLGLTDGEVEVRISACDRDPLSIG
jgi:dinuclear metal center YbgI/SA1388 family protein